MLTIELVAHMDAGDRRLWQGDQNERPLSELGQRQANALAEGLAAEPVEALFSSPALRCRQTLEPLARRFSISVQVMPRLRETNGFEAPLGWGQRHMPSEAYGGAFVTGRAYAALNEIRRRIPIGRAVVCSHRDTVPALAAFLNALHDLPLPEPPFRPIWYTLRFEGEHLDAILNDPPAQFPISAP